MNKKRNENRLSDRVKSEIDKAQQLSRSHHHKDQLYKFSSKKLTNDVVRRDKLLKEIIEPSQVLKDRIEQRQIALDDLRAEINNTEVEQHGIGEVVKQLITELRKFNPRKADEFEQLLSLKQGVKKGRNLRK
ncbi:hypothetical protein [Vibrio harveyi]|uniref:hypothetical protein n=1 Tax=Vibrio harveyi TaxID=669 RepID=UPI003BB52BD2